MALESKGFGAREDRTFYLQLNSGLIDRILLIGGALFVLASLYFNFRGYGDIPGLTRF